MLSCQSAYCQICTCSIDCFTTEKLSIKFLEELPNYLFDIIAKKWINVVDLYLLFCLVNYCMIFLIFLGNRRVGGVCRVRGGTAEENGQGLELPSSPYSSSSSSSSSQSVTSVQHRHQYHHKNHHQHLTSTSISQQHSGISFGATTAIITASTSITVITTAY